MLINPDTIPVVDLFPYKFKERDLFYDRDHPVIDPDSPSYKEYWREKVKGYIEGRWVYDHDTWVYMPGKLDFYANYAKIQYYGTDVRHPDLRCVEWIVMSYVMGADGFSGFQDDEEYTCNYYVGDLQSGRDLDEVELSKIPKEAKYPDGSGYKKYMHPWEYLTRHYLVDDKAARPLGKPLYQNRRMNGSLVTCRSLGKDNRWDTIVYTEDGKKQIKDIKIGDKIYGADGKLTTVVDRADYYNQMQYKVTFDDGRYTFCGDGHLWEVTKFGGSKGQTFVLPLKEIRKNYLGYERKEGCKRGVPGKRDTRYFVKICQPLQYPERDLPIDPYFLGLWLGDGTSKEPGITTMDEEIKDFIYEIADKYDLKVTVHKNLSKTCPTYHLTTGVAKAGKGNHILESLKTLNLINNKHIPEIYLRASEEQRMELLRGLMDSDGYISKSGHIEFVQKSKKLIDDFCDLVGGLGIKYSVKEKVLKFLYGKKLDEPKLYYRVKMNTGKDIFKLTRKRERIITDVMSQQSKSNRSKVGIRSIEPVGVDHSVCIALDNEDKLFVCDSHIVTHNSRLMFVGDLAYEHLLGDCESISDFGKNTTPLNFLAVSGDAQVLDRSIKALQLFYENQPGKYVKPHPSDPRRELAFNGVLYKQMQGQWETGGSKLQHIVKRKSGTPLIVGNSLEFRPIGEGKFKVGAGDRFRRFYCEEAGLTDPVSFYRFIKDSMKVGDEHIGSYFALGTSGDIKLVQPLASMVNSPSAYDIFSIPDYWRNPDKRIALFIPTPYSYRDYYDAQGNLKVELAYNKFFARRKEMKEELDGLSYESEVMHNPGTPDELLRPSNDSLMPKAEAQRQLNIIQAGDLFDKFAVGDFQFSPSKKYGVEFVKDLTFSRKPIRSYFVDRAKIDNRGCPIVYEFPDELHIPPNTYFVIYDPAMKQGQSASFHSVLVYKWLELSKPETLQDTIVAEWIGRYDSLEANYEKVIQIAKFFNAKIFPETNVPGFVDYCVREGYWDMLESDAYYLEQEIHGNKNIKRNYYRVGFQMNEIKKHWLDQKIPGYLKEARHHDPVTGFPTLRTIDWIFSERLLEEIVHHNDKDNFDHISTLRGVILLREKLLREGQPTPEKEEDELEKLAKRHIPEQPISRRPSFLKY